MQSEMSPDKLQLKMTAAVEADQDESLIFISYQWD